MGQSDGHHAASPAATAAGLLPAALAAALFLWFLQAASTVAAGDVVRVAWAWVPSLGISLSFLIDGLSLTFGLLITGIGALVMLYSSKYLEGHGHFGRFHLYLVLFMLSMLGLVLADNLLTLFVFWELTTITSYLLIGFDHAEKKARRSALQALLLTGTGGLALLAGFILIGNVAGTFELSEIRAQGNVLIDSALYLPILILVLAGTFTKSAQFPLHFWLPNAMAAPTPVSAYLHSATMVKAGIYLMARMHPNLGGTEVWMWTLTVFGAVTAVFASFMAVKQTDLKQALAYTTLMALGTLTLFLGSDTGYAITAAMTFLIVHSFYKAALFLIVGIIDHGTGTREADILGGLARAMPVTAAAAAVAALSMAGFPPFLGFIGKELKYAGALGSRPSPSSSRRRCCWRMRSCSRWRGSWRSGRSGGRGNRRPVTPHEGPWRMLAGPVLLAVAGALFGLAPGLLAATLVNPGVAAILRARGEAGRAQALGRGEHAADPVCRDLRAGAGPLRGPRAAAGVARGGGRAGPELRQRVGPADRRDQGRGGLADAPRADGRDAALRVRHLPDLRRRRRGNGSHQGRLRRVLRRHRPSGEELRRRGAHHRRLPAHAHHVEPGGRHCGARRGGDRRRADLHHLRRA